MMEKLRERNRFAKKLRRMRGRKGIERKEDIEVRERGRKRKIRDKRATERTDEMEKRKEYGRQFRRETIKECDEEV